MEKTEDEILAEIHQLREAVIADQTIKVGDERWRGAVARCKELRKLIRAKRRGSGEPVEKWTMTRIRVFNDEGLIRELQAQGKLPTEVT